MNQTHDPIEASAGKHEPHPRALAPANLLLTLALSLCGAVVGIQMLVSLGITPNTSLIGALAAMALARIPWAGFAGYRSIHSQNLAQTSISSASFGAANSLFLPIGIPFLFGLPEMVVPMLVGVTLAMLLDGFLLYRLFGSPAFPATQAWPMGVAAAEAIKAGDSGGRQARRLLVGLAVGAAGNLAGLPMSALGVALIGGMAAMVAFGIGLLVRGYAEPLLGIDLAAMYVPHGMMIGAGAMAVVQMARVLSRRAKPVAADAQEQPAGAAPVRSGRMLRLGWLGYLAIMILLTAGTGIYVGMPWPMLVGFVIYGTFSAFIHEVLVGIAAMHSGWFPAFAIALISLLIGIIIGFPPEALVVLAGFSAATGPAFADMGYDLKAGWLLRGEGRDPQFEWEGRRQQWLAGLVGFGVAAVVVALTHKYFFAQGLVAPINQAYVAAIKTGASPDLARSLVVWGVVGAAVQAIGGVRRQLGVLLATGLLIVNPMAGWMVALGLVFRVWWQRRNGAQSDKTLEVFAGGVIAGDALCGFGVGLGKSLIK
ncbi:MAG: OPT/YSL family transporter [Pseudoxanthomonas sp.]